MKNVKFVLIALIGMIIIIPNLTHAETIINNNGVKISEEDYENFLKIHSHEFIMNIDYEKYLRLKELDYNDITTETKYFATTYNPNLALYTETELTKEEYENFGSKGLSNGSASTETNAKILGIALVGGSTWNYVVLTATWKYIPTMRSYDVIGLRGDGFSFRNGSQSGEQEYKLSGTYYTINYSWNGTNIKKFSNGFGISMNIVNSSITALSLEIDCDVQATVTHPQIFGSYQHATSNLSLADSQNYTLGGGGLGSVFVFPSNISSKYDGMSGVHLTY